MPTKAPVTEGTASPSSAPAVSSWEPVEATMLVRLDHSIALDGDVRDDVTLSAADGMPHVPKGYLTVPVRIRGLVPLGEDGDPTADATATSRVTQVTYGVTLQVSAVTRVQVDDDRVPLPAILCQEGDPHELASMERVDAGRALVMSYWD